MTFLFQDLMGCVCIQQSNSVDHLETFTFTDQVLQNRFKIGQFIGQGTTGEVYKIKDLRKPKNDLVIKLTQDKTALEKEAQVLKKINKISTQTPRLIS